MVKEEILAKLHALPEAVQAHLYSEAVGELNEQIIDRNALPEMLHEALFDVVHEVIVKAVPVEMLMAEFIKRLGLPSDQAKKLALDVAGYRLLPLDKWLGDVSGYLRSLGGDINAYPKERVQIVTRTPEEAAEDLVKNVAPPDWEPHLRSRLKDIATSYYRGVRTDSQVLEMLTRAGKVGGMELTPSEAASIVEEMKEEARATIIGEKKPEPVPTNSPQPPKPRPKPRPTRTAASWPRRKPRSPP